MRHSKDQLTIKPKLLRSGRQQCTFETADCYPDKDIRSLARQLQWILERPQKYDFSIKKVEIKWYGTSGFGHFMVKMEVLGDLPVGRLLVSGWPDGWEKKYV